MTKEEVIYYLQNLINNGEQCGIVDCSASETDATIEALKEAIKLIKG